MRAELFAEHPPVLVLDARFSSRGDAGLSSSTVAAAHHLRAIVRQRCSHRRRHREHVWRRSPAFLAADETGMFPRREVRGLRIGPDHDFDCFASALDCSFVAAVVLEGYVFAVKAGGADDHWLFFWPAIV